MSARFYAGAAFEPLWPKAEVWLRKTASEGGFALLKCPSGEDGEKTAAGRLRGFPHSFLWIRGEDAPTAVLWPDGDGKLDYVNEAFPEAEVFPAGTDIAEAAGDVEEAGACADGFVSRVRRAMAGERFVVLPGDRD